MQRRLARILCVAVVLMLAMPAGAQDKPARGASRVRRLRENATSIAATRQCLTHFGRRTAQQSTTLLHVLASIPCADMVVTAPEGLTNSACAQRIHDAHACRLGGRKHAARQSHQQREKQRAHDHAGRELKEKCQLRKGLEIGRRDAYRLQQRSGRKPRYAANEREQHRFEQERCQDRTPHETQRAQVPISAVRVATEAYIVMAAPIIAPSEKITDSVRPSIRMKPDI